MAVPGIGPGKTWVARSSLHSRLGFRSSIRAVPAPVRPPTNIVTIILSKYSATPQVRPLPSGGGSNGGRFSGNGQP